jgi:hypothetical protein
MLGILDDFDLLTTTADLRRNFDSYYVLTLTPQSAPKHSWIDSDIKVNKEGAKAVAQKGFFAEQ